MSVRAARAMAALLLLAALPAAKAATITIVNLDGPNEGFNDPTPVTSEGGNAATTRGAQRLAVFQRAAEILGAQLQSGIEIKVGAQFDSFNADPDFGQPACSTGGGILGFAGPGTFSRDFPNAPVAGTWYPIALAEARAGTNLNGTANEVNASFNSDVDAACLGPGTRFWYGTVSTSPSGNLIALLPVVLHELSHGLGFLTLVCTSPSGCGSGNPQGSFASGFPDIWTNFLANSANPSLTWRNMTVAQRAASVTADPNTVWTGSNVTAAIPSVGISAGLSAGLLRMHAPAAFQPGSSISHFSSAASPNLLMEPAINTNLFAQLDMTIPLFRDIGWLQASNQSPSLTLDAGSASYTENGAPILIAPSATAGDADGNWSGGRLSVAISAGASADDRIGIGATGGISVSGSNVNDGATTFATLNASGGEVANTATLTATFNGSATNARVQALARAIQFRNVSDAPATSARTVAFTLVDGASASAPATRTITVAAVNDPPTLNLPVSVGITEDLAGTVVPVSFVDPDAGTGSVVATFSVPAGTLSATSAAGVTVGGSATARTLAGTLDAINTFLSLGALSYTGAANANGAVTLTVSINDQGNTGSGGVRIASDTTTLQIAPANDAPTVSAPASLALLGGASIGVSPVSYADPDAPFGGNVVATYAAPNGTFAATSGGGVTVAGSGTGTLTLTGPLASINSFVGATPVQYTAGSASGVVPLTLSINDQGNTGGAPLGGSRTVNATVTAEGTIFVNGFEG